MFLPAFHDLLKLQWLEALMELKISGGMAISDLSQKLGASYMTAKQHCEDLTKRGYLVRIRVPRTEIGRPEISYRLSEKAEALFPAISTSFSIDMLDYARQLFGDTAPEKLLYQYFQDREVFWKSRISKGTTVLYRAGLYVKLREKEGLFMRCMHDESGDKITLREFHHPLRLVFEKYPRAITMELRAMEEAIGVKISRIIGDATTGQPAYVDFIIS